MGAGIKGGENISGEKTEQKKSVDRTLGLEEASQRNLPGKKAWQKVGCVFGLVGRFEW